MKIVDVAAFRAKSGTVPPLRRLVIGIAAALPSAVRAMRVDIRRGIT